MKRMLPLAAALATAAAIFPAQVPAQSEKVRHYEARSSDNFAEAVTNFNEYNALMAEVLEAESLGVEQMERVHALTYTIEVALAKMVETLQALPPTLEKVHLASEGDDAEALRDSATTYLETAMELQ